MIITIIIFFLVLSVLVFVHELGHFWTALKFGTGVDEFGFGLPPRIGGVYKVNGKWRFIWGNKNPEEKTIVYSLNWIPIGGFVKIKGENGQDKPDADSFAAKPIWQRIVILAAGVIMNVLLCVTLLSIGYGVGTPMMVDGTVDSKYLKEEKVQILQAVAGFGAEKAGIKSGDELLFVDGQKITGVQMLRDYLVNKKDQSVQISVKRDVEEKTFSVEVKDVGGRAGIGVDLAHTAVVKYPWYRAIWEGAKTTVVLTGAIFTALFDLFKKLVTGVSVSADVAGPVGIAVITGQVTKLGLIYLLQFMAMLSLNLAVINILPLPALDGGRILFLIIEKLRGKAMKQQWENMAHNIGFILIMGLVVIITCSDLVKYGGRIWGGLKHLVGL
ncbi:MAG: RIP metalloprotease RseP [bacterium]